MLHVIFNSEGMWTYNDGGGGLHSSAPLRGEQSLEQILGDRKRLTPKYRKLASALLAACMFQLSDSPWIDQNLAPESIFVPDTESIEVQQWCPRVVCTLVPNISPRQQSDNIAAFGVLMLELETELKAGWEADDEDWQTGERSNSVRLARVLDSWKDYINDDYSEIAKACLEFDKLVRTLEHPDIVPERKGLAVIYKYILEPLFRHVVQSFGNLAPIFDGMFTAGHSLTAPIQISSSNTAKRELFDDDLSTPQPSDV